MYSSLVKFVAKRSCMTGHGPRGANRGGPLPFAGPFYPLLTLPPRPILPDSDTASNEPTLADSESHLPVDHDAVCAPTVAYPRQVEGPKRVRLPESERIERKRHRDEQLLAEERQLHAELPGLDAWVTEIHRHAPRGRAVARLRQLRRLLRDYPEAPLLAALRDAARYGLYDLDRIETMTLRNIRHDYFPRRDSDDDQD